jgi:hypothetical protein
VTAGGKPEMHELTVRDLMRQAMAAEEPSLGPVIGNAIWAARRVRRQRLITSAAIVVVIVPCLVLAAVALGGPVASRPAQPSAARRDFVRPVLPDVLYARIRPMTSTAFGQLLAADLPAGADRGRVTASVSPASAGAGRTARASLADVTTSAGSGVVQARMTAVGGTDGQFGCAGAMTRVSCHAYELAGGIEVMEEYAASSPATTHRQLLSFGVQVFRPHVALVSLYETNQADTPGRPVTKGMPIMAGQLLSAALDPRWQFWITQPVTGAGAGRGLMD